MADVEMPDSTRAPVPRATAPRAAASAGLHGIRPVAGFTLIELVVVVLIVAILSTIALPIAQLAVKRTKEQELRVSLRELRGAIDSYKKAVDEGKVAKAADASGYPKTLDVLVEGASDAKSPDQRNKLYFLRRIPRDPFSPPGLPARETWGKRSYQSPPDDPREGDDVFDVYSLSEQTGINGIAYREW